MTKSIKATIDAKTTNNVTADTINLKEEVIMTKSLEQANRELLEAIASAVGITVDQTQEVVNAQPELEEVLQFIDENADEVFVKDVNKAINKENKDDLALAISFALKSISKQSTSKGKDVANKASRLLATSYKHVLTFLNWSFKQGKRVFKFAFKVVKYVWTHISEVAITTLKFGGDVAQILFSHACEIVLEVGSAAQNRYSPVIASFKIAQA